MTFDSLAYVSRNQDFARGLNLSTFMPSLVAGKVTTVVECGLNVHGKNELLALPWVNFNAG